MKDPYSVLGMTPDASPEQLKSKYDELRAVYSEQRFKAGEEGNEGARKLQELEEAWTVVSSNLESNKNKSAFGGDYGQVDSLIRDGKYNEAQDILDSITDRRGEWHYMQAIVFYKREWLTEAKTQLEMALQDEPSNGKYRDSLEKLKLAMQNPAQQVNMNAGGTYVAPQSAPNQQPQPDSATEMSNCLSSCCCAYCLTDCLCSAMNCC